MKSSLRVSFAVALFAVACLAVGCKDAEQSGTSPDQSKAGKAAPSSAAPSAAPAPAGKPAATSPAGPSAAATVPAEKLKAFLPAQVGGFDPEKDKAREVAKGDVTSVTWTYTTAEPTRPYVVAVHFDGADTRAAEHRRDRAAARGGEKVTVGAFPAVENDRKVLRQLTVYVGKCSVILTAGKDDSELLRETAGKMDLAGLAKVGG